MLLVDTTVLIEYFRKLKKEETFFYELAGKYAKIGISTITRYEIMVGNAPKQDHFWQQLLRSLEAVSFDEAVADEAAAIQKELKKDNKIIGFADIAIAATARLHEFEIASLNEKHFNRIKNLKLVLRKG
jgi:tRNA(fMet)-specific endonuclease VapC